jgi:hypothetical protein
MQEEIWKPIKGFEGAYEVSNLGKVRSLDRYILQNGSKRFMKGREIYIKKDSYGYEIATLHVNGKKFYKKVHRLVGIAFIDNKDMLECINHKNFDRADNRVENLEWISRADNMRYSYYSGRYECISKFTEKANEVRRIPILDTYTGVYYDSITDFANTIGINRQTAQSRIDKGSKRYLKCQ